MCKIPLLFPIAILLEMGLILAQAGSLKWDRKTQILAAPKEAKQVEATFAFTNTSSQAVEFRGIHTSCGCTTAQSLKNLYKPGEQGEVKVVFTVGERKGIQEKAIIVETSEEKEVLTLRVEIPDVVKISPQALQWKVGDEAKPQAFEISLGEAKDASVKGVQSLNPDFAVTLQETEKGKSYRVEVKPASTAKAATGMVRLQVADPAERSIYLRVEVHE